MSNASTRKTPAEAPAEIDWGRAKRVVRPRKGRERIPLASVRKIVGKTQVEVADAAEMPQGDVSRVEGRSALGEDVRLSTLRRYARGLGGEVELAIVIGGHRYLVDV
jgi:hypothetical protein